MALAGSRVEGQAPMSRKAYGMHNARTSALPAIDQSDRALAVGSHATMITRTVFAALLLLALLCPWRAAHAVGTPAGTTITNMATVNFSVAGVPATTNTQPVSFRVDELISVRVDPPPVPTNVNSPDTNKVLVFKVTNVGNGPESFALTPILNPPVPDQFNPASGGSGVLFLDVNGNGQLDIGTDTLISGPLTINPDKTAQVLFVANIPPGLANGNQGVVTLAVAATTAGAIVAGAGVPPGTILPNGGTPVVGGPGIDAVVGAGAGGAADSGADDAANGTYFVSTVAVTVAKTIIAVTDLFGRTTTGCNGASPPVACTTFVPGTVVQYQLTVMIAGSGTAQGVLVTDDTPANTTYVANSMRFNAAARTDQVDGDNASCTGCGNAAGTLSVNIGDVPVLPATPVIHIIDYKVSIN